MSSKQISDYIEKVKKMDRNNLICELCSASNTKAKHRNSIIASGAFLGIGSATAALAAVFNGENIDIVTLTTLGSTLVSSLIIGGINLCVSAEEYNLAAEKIDIVSRYVDDDVKEAYKLTKK